MRCWGSSEPSRTGGLDFERSDCVMDTRIFVGEFTTGTIALRHESYDGSQARPAALRGALLAELSQRVVRAPVAAAPDQAACNEDFVDRDGLPLRAVVCMRAYKKLPQLYDVAVLVATLDQTESGVQGRFDAQGVSFANAQRLAQPLPRRLPMGAGALARRALALLEVLDRDGHRAPGLAHRALAGDDRPRPRQRRRADRSARRRAPRDASTSSPAPTAAPRDARRQRRRRPSTASASAASASPAARARTLADSGRDLDLHIGRTAAAPAPAGPRARRPSCRWRRSSSREHALAADPRRSRWRCSPSSLFNTWIDTDPDGLGRALGRRCWRRSPAAALWCGLWALLSKTFTRQSHFGWHVRVFVIASLALLALGAAAAAARVRVLVAVDHRLQLRRHLSRSAATAIYFHLLAVEPARAAADARGRRDRLRGRRRPARSGSTCSAPAGPARSST